MSRQIGLPVQVEVDDATGESRRLTWCGVRYTTVRVIGRWHLRDWWWDMGQQTDRVYYRLLTRDQQVFEVYRELTSAGLWVLDRVLD